MSDTDKFNWNILIFDFIEFMPYLGKFLLGLNYKNFKLEITSLAIQKKANKNCMLCESAKKPSYKELGDDYIQVEDHSIVMKNLRDHIVEGNSLFILDFKEDLGLNFSEGQVAIAYRFIQNSSDQSKIFEGVAAFSFSKDTKFLLNFYNHRHHGQYWEAEDTNDMHNVDPEQNDGSIELNSELVTSYNSAPGETSLAKSGLIIDGMVHPGKSLDNLDLLGNNMVMEYKKSDDGKIDFSIN